MFEDLVFLLQQSRSVFTVMKAKGFFRIKPLLLGKIVKKSLFSQSKS